MGVPPTGPVAALSPISYGIPYNRSTGCKSHAKEDKCLHLDPYRYATPHTCRNHPCEPTENIWVGESKPAALACAEAAWEQSSLEHLSTPGPNHTRV